MVTTTTDKSTPNRLLWYVAGVFIAAAFVQSLLPRDERIVVVVVAWFPIAVLLFNWCKTHAHAAGVGLPAGYAPLCGLLPLLGVPLYFLRTFGLRKGVVGILKAVGFYLLIALTSEFAGATGAFLMHPATFSAALYFGISTEDSNLCIKGDGAPQVAACSRMIASGSNEDDAILASLFYNRGNGKLHQGDLDGAIADYTQAIELNPRHANAHVNRGLARLRKNDLDGAIRDDDRAAELDPHSVLAFLNRGTARAAQGDYKGAAEDDSRVITLDQQNAQAYTERCAALFSQGDMEGAIPDCDRAIELGTQSPVAYQLRGVAWYIRGDAVRAVVDLTLAEQMTGDAHVSLALYLARTRAHQNGRRELAASTARFDRMDWPAPVVALYLGKSTPESLLAAATRGDPQARRGQICEANYYLAQWALLRTERSHSLALLKEAVTQCPLDFVERGSAIAQINQLSAY